METIRISDMRQKEVIDLEEGQIQSLIVPGESRMGLFGKSQDIIIPWDSIRKIGNDIVLVDFE